MKIVRKRNSISIQTIGYQIKLPGVDYEEHGYLIREGNAIYNALTGEAAIVSDADTFEMMKNWYTAPKGMNLAAFAHIMRQQAHKMKQSKFISRFIIFTTTGCNGACEYCFQHGLEAVNMSEKTATDVAQFILKKSNPGLEVKIRWFGGEPLVNKAVMSQICQVLKDNNRAYTSSMSSNGDLLHDVSTEEMLLWRMKSVQVTVDAPGEEYDRIKGLPAGAYERLKETIERFTGVSFTIRVHYDPKKGSDPCYQVVDDFKKYPNVIMYAAMLYDTEKTQADYEELLKIEDYMIECGKMTPTIPQMNPDIHCMADNLTAACITPVGDLTPCEHFVTGESYGTIYSDERDADVLDKWAAKCKDRDECVDCPLYPSCEMLCNCESDGICSDGYQFYKISKIKRALKSLG